MVCITRCLMMLMVVQTLSAMDPNGSTEMMGRVEHKVARIEMKDITYFAPSKSFGQVYEGHDGPYASIGEPIISVTLKNPSGQEYKLVDFGMYVRADYLARMLSAGQKDPFLLRFFEKSYRCDLSTEEKNAAFLALGKLYVDFFRKSPDIRFDQSCLEECRVIKKAPSTKESIITVLKPGSSQKIVLVDKWVHKHAVDRVTITPFKPGDISAWATFSNSTLTNHLFDGKVDNSYFNCIEASDHLEMIKRSNPGALVRFVVA